MVAPCNQENAAYDPDDKADLLGTDGADLPDPKPPEDAKAGAGVLEYGCGGNKCQGDPARFFYL